MRLLAVKLIALSPLTALAADSGVLAGETLHSVLHSVEQLEAALSQGKDER